MPSVTALTIDVRPVGPDDWAELAAFFGPSGAYSGCWCVWWRRTSGEFQDGLRDGSAGNRALLERVTREGRVPGLLAYDGDGQPIGWVSVAPRHELGRVLRSPALKPRPGDGRGPADDEGVWAVVCFWVPRGGRGKGVGTALLSAAVEQARSAGASALEGYPVDTDGPAPAADLFTGTLAMFRRAGFTPVRPPAGGQRRHIVRRTM